jgi:hypothetical protein
MEDRDPSEVRVRKVPIRDREGGFRQHPKYQNRLHRKYKELLATDRQAVIAEEVCTQYLRGLPQYRIAAELEVSIDIVRDIIDQSREVWMERAGRAMSEMIAEQVAKIDAVEQNAWECFEKSKKDFLETHKATEDTDKGIANKSKTVHRKQVGGIDWMKIILQCVKQRCDLLGLGEESKDSSQAHGSMLVVVRTPAEHKAICDYQEFQKIVDGTVETIEDGE